MTIFVQLKSLRRVNDLEIRMNSVCSNRKFVVLVVTFCSHLKVSQTLFFEEMHEVCLDIDDESFSLCIIHNIDKYHTVSKRVHPNDSAAAKRSRSWQ